jgi:hypothetical protein
VHLPCLLLGFVNAFALLVVLTQSSTKFLVCLCKATLTIAISVRYQGGGIESLVHTYNDRCPPKISVNAEQTEILVLICTQKAANGSETRVNAEQRNPNGHDMKRQAEAINYIGGNVRKQFTVPEGWVESFPDIPADCHIAEMKVCTDCDGFTRRLFRITLKKSVQAVLAAKALATVTAVHNDNVAASDRQLLRRRHRQGLR